MRTVVYKYVKGLIFRKIVYVGITNDLKRRHAEHLTENRIFGECRLYYITVWNRKRAKKIESYLIRKYEPRLNKAEKHSRDFKLFHLPFFWHRYRG